MTIIRELVQSCQKCPLHEHMEVSPVAPEYWNDPRGGLMIILGNPLKQENDYTQEVITGINRACLIKLLKEHSNNYYITPLVKCCPINKSRTYQKAHINKCRSWLTEEFSRVRPNLVIGFGKLVEEVLSKSDVPPWTKCDYYLGSVNNVVNNKRQRENLINILGKLNKDKNEFKR